MSDVGRCQASLGIVTAMRAFRHADGVYIHLSFGRIIDRLALRFEKIYLSLPLAESPPDVSADYRLEAPNIEVLPQPYYASSMGALKSVLGVARAYLRTCRATRNLFIRGMCPYVFLLYACAWLERCSVTHWIVGDPVALLGTHRRAGWVKDALARAFAMQDRLWSKLGRRLTGGAFVCNGQELGRIHASKRTIVTVSSTVTLDEIHERFDTCQGPLVRILFVGFLRPEKGVEYLIEALGRLKTGRPWRMNLVGPCDKFPGYRRKLEGIAVRLGVADRFSWSGYASYGPELFRHLREADVFVLPTLSEGTPRVLVEARAFGLPIISTVVGGIPTSVTNGVDGLLVPPKDVDALADAMDRVIAEPELRQRLIHNGLQSARRLTVDHFVATVMEVLKPGETTDKT